MVEIKPFKGLLYNKEKIKDFSLVITPPYDVISEEKKADYLKRSHYNFVNLILADSHDGAAKTLTKFQNNGVLKQDDEESIYIYQQRYMVDGKNYTRTGFIALLKLEGFGKNILPHEKTMDRPYENRLRLLKATKANLGTILMMYDDKKKVIDKKIKEKIEKPYINFDADGINHKLFKIDDPRFAEFVKVNMKNQQCIIADGHHRYRASLQYSKEKNYNYVMACFVNSFNEGMVILPTNRLISGLQNPHYMTNRMRACFDVKEVDSIEIINKGMKNAGIFGFYDNILGKSYLLKLRGLGDVKLDVEILHQKII